MQLQTFFCALSLALCGPRGNSILTTLLINVYLPTDYGISDSNNAFLESLGELEGFISMQSFDNIIICGDFNVHFSQSNHNCIQFLTFMRIYNQVCADLSCNIKYTYRRDDYTSFSWPDHILTVHLIRHITCTNDAANFSDHLPFYFCRALDQHYLLSTLKPQVDVRWTPLSIKFELNAVTSGVLFQIKKKTTKGYKYEVRRLRWQRERIIRKRLGIALFQSSHRDFWKEVCNITLSSKGRGSSAPIVDGCSSDADISPAFSAKLCDVLNSNTSLENPLSCDELP